VVAADGLAPEFAFAGVAATVPSVQTRSIEPAEEVGSVLFTVAASRRTEAFA